MKIAFFLAGLLETGSGAENFFIESTKNLSLFHNVQADVISMNKNFTYKILPFLSLYYRKKMKIRCKKSRSQITTCLGKAHYYSCKSVNDLKYKLRQYDIIYSKNEIIEACLLKFIGYHNLPPVFFGIHTPHFYTKARSWQAKLHNLLYNSCLYRWLISGCVGLHVSNKSDINILKNQFPNKKIELIYYPFSIEIFKKQKAKFHYVFDKSKTNIIFLGRLTEQKGINDLVRIITKINDQKDYQKKIIFNIVGDGEEADKILLLNKQHPNINFLGWVEAKFIPNILKSNNLLISCSLWETFPYNIIEAQAMNLPVIAYNIPGIKDIVVNRKTGILVNNPDQFIKALTNFINGKYKFHQIDTLIKKRVDPKIIYPKLLKFLTSEKMSKKLNFGCGRGIKKDYINVDITPFEGVDYVFNFNQFPYPFPNDEFDFIYADNILEHLEDIPKVMRELHRIAKNNALVQIVVPYYHCYGAFNDVTHKHYFSPLSFEPFYKKNTRANYFIKEKFELKELKLIPTRLGKIFLFDFIRRPLSFILGQIYQSINITLIVKKQ
jgi:glycosyltransferase involved in cell wall biosynthesis